MKSSHNTTITFLSVQSDSEFEEEDDIDPQPQDQPINILREKKYGCQKNCEWLSCPKNEPPCMAANGIRTPDSQTPPEKSFWTALILCVFGERFKEMN